MTGKEFSQIYITGNRTALYCIIGMPAHHSLSPAMHNAAFEKLGIDAVFLAFDVPKDALHRAIEGMKAYGIKGMTLTSPHKEEALRLVDRADTYSSELGAVNTIINKNGKLYGYNTDEAGFVNSLKSQHATRSSRYTIIGAGGAARACAFGLVRFLGAKDIRIINRTIIHAKELKNDLERNTGVSAQVAKLRTQEADNMIKESDFVINATNITLENSSLTPVKKELLDEHMVVFDANYVPLENRLIKEAKARGCTTINGIELLVNQGIEAFKLFTGRNVSYDVMKNAVIKVLS
ncbi:MAG: shikimate dehydrogenase [Candidatus Micrarchaeia archaeon]